METLATVAAVGLGLWGTSQLTKGLQSSMQGQLDQLSSIGAQTVEAMPEVAVNPTVPTEEATNVEAETEAARLRAAAATAESTYNPTSGLGIQTTARGQSRTLAGMA